MDHICQKYLPGGVTEAALTGRLPGMQRLERMADWLLSDDAFAGQMALRAQLLQERPGDVAAVLPEAEEAVQELSGFVQNWLRGPGGQGYSVGREAITRPDGVEIARHGVDPLTLLAHLVQEDFCILQRGPDEAEHRLTAALLCFPASWTLAEKMGRPLLGIHAPVEDYDAGVAARVQRMFDNLRTGAPIWRQNALLYHDPSLYQPRRESDPRDDRDFETPFFRSERQTLLRLPETKAIVFSIHTYVVALTDLDPALQKRLREVETRE